MKLAKLLAALLVSTSLLTGCLASNTPAQNAGVVLSEAQAQHAALTAALNSYCGVVEASDSELVKYCAQVQSVVNPSTVAIQTALSLIVELLARRKVFEKALADTREVQCAK